MQIRAERLRVIVKQVHQEIKTFNIKQRYNFSDELLLGVLVFVQLQLAFIYTLLNKI